jgi:hypothetical protein
MPNPLKAYNERLNRRRISTWLPPQELPGPKFYPNGRIKPFYGLTCIAWLEQESELFRKLHDSQRTFKQEFEQAGLAGLFTFLAPESFHMTICDIHASPHLGHIQLDDRIEQVWRAFEQMKKPGRVTCLIKGIGLKQTIAALVRFDADPGELETVLAVERRIKRVTGVNVRQFVGHISLAYLVRHPGHDIDKIKKILLPYEDRVFGQFAFSQFDLTFFTDMNTYIPILTVDLENGAVAHHEAWRERLTWPSSGPPQEP